MRINTGAGHDLGERLRGAVTGTVALAAASSLLLVGLHLASPALRLALLAAVTVLNLAVVLLAGRAGRLAAARPRVEGPREPAAHLLDRAALVACGSADAADRTVALAMIDLDGLRAVNDLHGHAAGDRLLHAAAQAIRAELPPAAPLARLGGDAFACLLPFDPARPHALESLAERIALRLAQPFPLGAARAHLTAAIGLARADGAGAGIEDALRRANIALSAARRAGRGRHAWFDPAMEEALLARHAIEQALRTGIPLGQFVPYYEQQVDLVSGTLGGFEVLARWNHPTRGLLGPDAFLAVAEESGLLGELSLSVMRQAFEQARGWDASLTLACNISPAQLKDPWLAEKIVKLLVETGFPPGRLEIEITENALFENLAVARSIVTSLKNQGIRIALDDFGTGYSSLAHLRALPFDRIKIDRSFVTAMIEDAESAAIVGAIVQLGESLGLPITAEGVENEGIEARLVAMGLRNGQGWRWGRPMPVAATRRLLAERALIPVARGAAPPTGRLRKAG